MLSLPLLTAGAQRHSDPDSARLVVSDIPRFWAAFDEGTPLDLEARFRDYIDRGSVGLRAFAPHEIGTGFDLARQVYNERPRYEVVRAATLRARDAEPAVRATYRRLKAMYPPATLLDAYVVIGRFTVGGWTRGDTMVIAAELYPDSKTLPWIVAHEIVHRQQPPAADDQTLLERAFNEGSADFIGELISGGNINPAAQRNGRAHERRLWKEFQTVMSTTTYAPWMYAPPTAGRPRDLGYFIGYRIAQAYYQRAPDKRAAIREIIEARDVSVILKRSGYAP